MDSKGLLGDDIMIVCEMDKLVDLFEEIVFFGIWK